MEAAVGVPPSNSSRNHSLPVQAWKAYESGLAKASIGRQATLRLPPLSRDHEGTKTPIKTETKTPQAKSENSKKADTGVSERVVGVGNDAVFVGMRVVIRRQALMKDPTLKADSGGGFGTVTAMAGDEVGTCKVKWDNGQTAGYKVGQEGEHVLAVACDATGHGRKDPSFTSQDTAECQELVVGIDEAPKEGMRVVLRKAALDQFHELLDDCGWLPDGRAAPGTITWVDPDDADGDGVPGDIVEVLWDVTGTKEDYRTGFEGCYRLAVWRHDRVGEGEESCSGTCIHPPLLNDAKSSTTTEGISRTGSARTADIATLTFDSSSIDSFR